MGMVYIGGSFTDMTEIMRELLYAQVATARCRGLRRCPMRGNENLARGPNCGVDLDQDSQNKRFVVYSIPADYLYTVTYTSRRTVNNIISQSGTDRTRWKCTVRGVRLFSLALQIASYEWLLI